MKPARKPRQRTVRLRYQYFSLKIKMPDRYERIEVYVHPDGEAYVLDFTFKGWCNFCDRLPDNPALTTGKLRDYQQMVKTPCCRRMICIRCMEWIMEIHNSDLWVCPVRANGCKESWTHFPVWDDQKHLRGILVTSDHYTENYATDDGDSYEVKVYHLGTPSEEMTD